MFLVFFPVFSDRSFWDSWNIREKPIDITPMGDSDAEMYIWSDTGGYGSMPHWVVNKSFAKSFLKEHFQWRLMASANNNTWYDANELLNVGLLWDDVNSSYKVTLTLNTTGAPRDLFYRFDLACNKSLKDFVDVDGWEWRLTIPGNGTGDVQVFFNWSDIKSLVQSGKVWFSRGVTDNRFWFRVQTVNRINPGMVFVVDPWYGVIADTVVSSYEWDAQEGRVPDVCRVNNSEYYLIAFGGETGTERHGWLRTIQVDDDTGIITASAISSYEFLNSEICPSTPALLGSPRIVHITGTDKYAVAYQDRLSAKKVRVSTFQVWDNNGTINPSIIDTQSLTNNGTQMDMINVINNVYVIIYTNVADDDGILETITINNDGTIDNAILSTVDIDGTCYYPDLLMLDSDTIAITYRFSGLDGNLQTRNITSAGVISASQSDAWEFDAANNLLSSDILNIGGYNYAIVYTTTSNIGKLGTVTIQPTGMITKSWIDTLTPLSPIGQCNYLKLFTINAGSVYGFTYGSQTALYNVNCSTVNISSAGVIGDTLIDTIVLGTPGDCYSTFRPLYINKSYYLDVTEFANLDGWAFTIYIETNWNVSWAGSPSPANNSIDQVLSPLCSVAVSDMNGDTMTVTFAENTTGSWVNRQTNSSVANSTVYWSFTQANTGGTVYNWRVYVNDSFHNQSYDYSFMTIQNVSRVFTPTLWMNNSFSNQTWLWKNNVLNLNNSFSNSTFIWKSHTLDMNNSFSNSSFLWRNNVLNMNNSFSNSTFTWDTHVLDMNNSFSNQTFLWKPSLWFNSSFSNSTFHWDNTLWINNSFSNQSWIWHTHTLDMNNSFSNSSAIAFTPTLWMNNSFSNSTFMWDSALWFNSSFSNQTFLWHTNTLNLNNSFSNTSSFEGALWFNSSFSNSTFTWNNHTLDMNNSFSNSTWIWQPTLWFVCSFSNTSLLPTESPLNLNLYVHNPNPGNGTHQTNYIKRNTSNLTTAVDIIYENFTSPPAILPGNYSTTIIGTTPANTPVIWNTSAIYTDAWGNLSGAITPGNPYVGQYLFAGDYTIFRSFLLFDTSILPDNAIINSGYVSLVIMDDYSDTDFNVTIQQCKPPYFHNPLTIGDYWEFPYNDDYGTLNTSGYTDEDVFNIELNASGLSTYLESIQLTGYTKWALRSDEDIAANAPSGDEFVIFYGYGVDVSKYPRLILNYTIPVSNWQYIVNLTWSSNSSGGWENYSQSHVFSNGTTSVLNSNFTGEDTYYWYVGWESNHSNYGNTSIFEFETVNITSSGGGAMVIGQDRFTIGIVLGIAIGMFLFGRILWKRRKKG